VRKPDLPAGHPGHLREYLPAEVGSNGMSFIFTPQKTIQDFE
jgi:hypothetical protein